MNAGQAFPDMEHRFGAFADVGPEAEVSAYFATEAEAIEYARSYWQGLTAEEREGIDVYAGEINLHKATHGTLAGRLVWNEVRITYDAKFEERRQMLAELDDEEVDA